ncbi:MAG: penicillin-binding protein activator [Candidatus Aenigmarchaeota archaeon]|nr:penicillin-binding protein activator [Candidatus Aenigmarchaeota archaeon]
MKRSLKIVIVVVILIVLATTIILLQPTGQATGKKEVKVGAILSLTGDYSIFGNALRQGLEIAKEELNERSDIQYRLIVEDDGNVEVRKAVEAGRKLIDIDNVDVSFVTAANEGKSLSGVFEEEKTPLMVLFDTNKELEKGDYTFGIGFSTEAAAHSMAKFAYSKSVRNVAVVYSFDDWSRLIASSFKEEFEQLGGTVAILEGTNPNEQDFRTVVEKSQAVDAIYAPTLLPSYIVKQSKEIGYKGYMLSADGLNQNQIDVSKGAAEGVYHTNVYVPNNEKLQKLRQAYVKKYGKDPEIIELTAVGYDAMYAVDAAVRAKGIGREEVKSGLYEIHIEGATGVVDFDETGMSPRFEHVFVVENGTAVLVE